MLNMATIRRRRLMSSATGIDYSVGGNEPAVVADFVNEYYRVGGSETTFASMFTFGRTGSAYYLNSSGVWTEAATGVARVGSHIWNGSAWVNSGILIETQARTNLLLNSGTLSTQDVTTSATPYTLSFSGTGTVTLSGTSTAGPLVGTGTGENNRVNLTFTPTAGTLTLTVSGTVTNAQLEAGQTPSSYIPTAGTAVTRNADSLVIAAAKMPSVSTALSAHYKGYLTFADTAEDVLRLNWGTAVPLHRTFIATNGAYTGAVRVANFASGSPGQHGEDVPGSYSPGINIPFNCAVRQTDAGTGAGNSAVDGVLSTEFTGALYVCPTIATNFNITDVSGSLTLDTLRFWALDLGDTGIATASS